MNYGGTLDDIVNSAKKTADGGFVFAGYSYSNNNDLTSNSGSNDGWVVKTNSIGVIVWQKSYGSSGIDEINSISQTSDGGYILCGTSTSSSGTYSLNHGGGGDVLLIKTNNVGVVVWQKLFGGTDEDFGYSVIQTNDGGYIFNSTTFSNDGDVSGNHGLSDAWAVKTNSVGVIEWQKCYGSLGNQFGFFINQTNDGGYIMCCRTNSGLGEVNGYSGNVGSAEAWIVKTNSLGVILWNRCLQASVNDDDYREIKQTLDGGYITAGGIDVNVMNSDIKIFKLDALGANQWVKTLYAVSGNENAKSIIESIEGGYIISGTTTSSLGIVSGNYGGVDNWVIKIGNTGLIEWQKCLGGTNSDGNGYILQLNDGGYVLVGNTLSNNGSIPNNYGQFDIYANKLSSTTGINEPDNFKSFYSIFPNPANDLLNLIITDGNVIDNFVIIDLLGRKVLEQKEKTSQINIKSLEKGIYQLIITSGDMNYSIKFIKE
jgi:hypothetical protein